MATIPHGVMTGALSAAGSVTFADRYAYVQVTNTGTSAVYVSTDPTVTTPSATTANTVTVAAGQTETLGNAAPPWYQSYGVIAQGSDNANQQSKYGHASNPGTTVSAGGTVTALDINCVG